MKIQNCPICKSKPLRNYIRQLSKESGEFEVISKLVACPDAGCDFYVGDEKDERMWIKENIWNRIRYAPDDKDVRATKLYDTNLYDTDLKNWMNPNYPNGDCNE